MRVWENSKYELRRSVICHRSFVVNDNTGLNDRFSNSRGRTCYFAVMKYDHTDIISVFGLLE